MLIHWTFFVVIAADLWVARVFSSLGILHPANGSWPPDGDPGPRQPICGARPCSQSHRRLRCGRRSNGGWSGSQGTASCSRGKGANIESGWLPAISHGESPFQEIYNNCLKCACGSILFMRCNSPKHLWLLSERSSG